MAAKVIVFSGCRASDDLKMQIKKKMPNATVATAISGKTTHLIVKETSRGSKKIAEAEEKGIVIMSFDEFMVEYGLTTTANVENERSIKKKETEADKKKAQTKKAYLSDDEDKPETSKAAEKKAQSDDEKSDKPRNPNKYNEYMKQMKVFLADKYPNMSKKERYDLARKLYADQKTKDKA
jgi:hypothetical protein